MYTDEDKQRVEQDSMRAEEAEKQARAAQEEAEEALAVAAEVAEDARNTQEAGQKLKVEIPPVVYVTDVTLGRGAVTCQISGREIVTAPRSEQLN
ncbi:hypothetical protein SCP_0705530 [Sparassis crispa]|uniref:Uncharacterized protein n=1 Tax=Sparassis crispa TaxID=139825 RepID=A0A401GT31_9APHY|nr:hypothetical protein SCP_0705530 [Sparassis crispa]GBE85366.1 hypothetical protein SCP_0705530 [Sparassis crispa]